VEICTAYSCGSRTLTEFPSDLAQLVACKPVYQSMPGWTSPTRTSQMGRRPTPRSATSRGWKKCPAFRRPSSRPDPSGTTRSSGTT
jgi:hypothetical protein